MINPAPRQPITFVIKTSFDCNLACSYCYEGQKESCGFLSPTTATNLIKKAGKYAKKTNSFVTFVWHGGEPLLAGHEFYSHVLQEQKKLGHGFHYRNSLQTNGLLLNKKMATFLHGNKFNIGVSLDGPEIIHDAQRITKFGKPTFNQAFSAIKNLVSVGAETGALAIFTRNTLDHLDAFYDFFKEKQLDLQINPLLVSGNAAMPVARSLQITPAEYGEALTYLYERWVHEPTYTFSINPFFNATRSLMSGRVYSCHFAGQCSNFYKVFPNGDLYLCGKQNDQTDVVGNINTETFASIVSSPKREKYALEKACVKEACGKCTHFDMCHGGCSATAYMTQKDSLGRDYYCESYKMLFDRMKTFVPKSVQRSLSPATMLNCVM